MKYGMTPQIQKAFQEGLKKAEGAAGEDRRLVPPPPHVGRGRLQKKGGGQDLGMITTMMFGAFQELKTLGINPGPIVDRTQKNLGVDLGRDGHPLRHRQQRGRRRDGPRVVRAAGLQPRAG